MFRRKIKDKYHLCFQKLHLLETQVIFSLNFTTKDAISCTKLTLK